MTPKGIAPWLSTVKSSIGFLQTQLARGLPERWRSSSLASIFNYLPLSDILATAGQPNEKQFAAIERAGFRSVINLAPHGVENALPDERSVVTGLGLSYVHIPVDFKNPTEADYQEFCRVMGQTGETKVFVHCAANMRVSAFLFRYRTQVLGESLAIAQRDLHQIWVPFGVWAEFILRGGADVGELDQ